MTEPSRTQDVLLAGGLGIMSAVAFGAAISKFGEAPALDVLALAFGGVLFLVGAFGAAIRALTGEQPAALVSDEK